MSVVGANALAFEAIPLPPCFAAGRRLATTGLRSVDGRTYLTWPLWRDPFGLDTVRSLLAQPGCRTDGPPRAEESVAWAGPTFKAERVANGDYSNISPARPR